MTKPDLIVTEDSNCAGMISYWRLSGPVTLAKLYKAAQRALYPRHPDTIAAMLPKPPTDEVALGRAVREQGGPRRLVRPLAKHGAWAIVDETVTPAGPGFAEQLTYQTVLRVNHKTDGPEMNGADPLVCRDLARTILDAFYRHRGELAPEDISAWLIKLANQNAAVTLRDTGGIYFVPRPAVPFWRSVASALESVSTHRVFKIPAMTNSEAVEAITEAVAAEVEQASATMMAELSGEEQLGTRALKTRAAECAALLAKAAQYEKLLNVQLPKVMATIEGLQASVAAAALSSAAQEA